MFITTFSSYIGYAKDQRSFNESSKEESLMSFLCLVQCILLASFAAILGAHRSEILDKPVPALNLSGENSEISVDDYTPPNVAQA